MQATTIRRICAVAAILLMGIAPGCRPRNETRRGLFENRTEGPLKYFAQRPSGQPAAGRNLLLGGYAAFNYNNRVPIDPLGPSARRERRTPARVARRIEKMTPSGEPVLDDAALDGLQSARSGSGSSVRRSAAWDGEN